MATFPTPVPNAYTIQPPSGSSTLPVFELDKTLVKTPRTPVTALPIPLGDNAQSTSTHLGDTHHSPLAIDAWPFFHAAAKTELARTYSAINTQHHGMSMYGCHGDMLRWQYSELRIKRHGILSRKDASRTYLAGRFGEAILYLFMQERDFVYWDHLPSLVDRHIHNIPISHAEQIQVASVINSAYQAIQKKKGPLSEPDFAFEKSDATVALAESKGRFVKSQKRSNFKGDLKKALTQIEIWQSLISGSPDAYAVGTYLREAGDLTDSSLIAFTDPPADPPVNNINGLPIEFPPDWIRRGNYAAWLDGMGLQKTASALRNGEIRRPESIELFVVALGDREYVIPPFHDGIFVDVMYLVHLMETNALSSSPVFGLEVNVMEQIQTTIRDGQGAEALLSLEPIDTELPAGVYGSVFRDGSLYALLRANRRLSVRSQIFKL